MNDIDKALKIIIIGGSIAGLTAAKRAKRLDESLDITIIDQSSYICYPMPALPIFSSGIIKKIESIYSKDEESLVDIYNIKLFKNHKAVEIDRKGKKVVIRNLKSEKKFELPFDKLILATGSTFKLPKLILKNIDNVFTLNTLEDAIKIKEYIEKTSTKEITIVGSNYHALVTANCFIKVGFEVTIINKKAFDFSEFDPEFRFLIKDELVKNGVKLYLNAAIKKYVKSAKGKIGVLELSNGASIKTQIVILFDNYSMNTDLAEKCDLETGVTGRIKVDNKMQTSDPDIYAAGSIAEVMNLITKKSDKVKLAIPVQIQGRIAGSAVAGQDIIYKGAVGTSVLKIQNFTFGSTGLNQSQAQKNEIDTISVTLFAGDQERYYPGNEKLHLKITVNKDNRKIIGAQVSGSGNHVDKNLDIFVTAIFSEYTIDDLSTLDLSYSPELSIQRNQINTLGMIASNILDNITTSKELKDLVFDKNVCFLDIRNKKEYEKSHIERSIWIPLNELRSRVDELPKDVDIYIYGHIGLRGYIAERILRGSGYTNVYNIEGGITAIKLLEKMS